MTAPTPALEREVRATGSASLWVLGLLAGPRQHGAVLHAGADAVYVGVDGVCLGILGGRAVQVPCGVRTSLSRLPDVPVGAVAVLEEGSVSVPHLSVHVTEIVDTTVPVLGLEAAGRGLQALAADVGTRLDDLVEDLPDAALVALRAGDPRAARGLMGLGPGLTPLGDDVLCGWLATAVAVHHPALAAMQTAVALAARERTTTLSATLLTCAARGEGVPQLHDLLAAVAHDDGSVSVAVEMVLSIGDTSGGGLLLGARLALESAMRAAG